MLPKVFESENGSGAGAPGNNGQATDDFDFDKTVLWDQEGQEEQEGAQQDQQPQQIDPLAVFREQVAKFGVAMPEVSADDITELFQGQNPAKLQAYLNATAQQTYEKAMIDSVNIFNKLLPKAIEQAVAQATAKTQGIRAVDAMHAALPNTKHPNISPVAETMLNQFMQSGKSVDQAIEGVRGFFGEITKRVAKDLNLNVAPKPTPGTKRNRQQSETGIVVSEQEGGEKKTNWAEILGQGTN